ncbi:MFS transporter [Streptomyces tubercidicus]
MRTGDGMADGGTEAGGTVTEAGRAVPRRPAGPGAARARRRSPVPGRRGHLPRRGRSRRLLAHRSTGREAGHRRAHPPARNSRGIRQLWRDRVLRAVCVSVALGNAGIGALIATLVVVIKGWLGAGDSGYVVVTTGYGIGMVLGGLLAGRTIAAVGGRGRTLLLAGVLQAVTLVGLGTLRTVWLAAVLLGLFGFAGMVWNVLETTVVQQRSPAGMLGRISAAFRTVPVAGTPLGALCGGAAATAFGPNAPALLAAALPALGTAALTPVLQPPDGAPSGGGQIPPTAR